MLRKILNFSFFPTNTVLRTTSSTNTLQPYTQRRKQRPFIPTTYVPHRNLKLHPQTIIHRRVLAIRENRRRRRATLPKIPQTEDPQVVLSYVRHYLYRMGLPTLVTAFEKLAELKSKTHVSTTSGTMIRAITRLCREKLHKNPAALSSLIKYAAVIGIKDRFLWTKFVDSIRLTDLSQKPHEIGLIINFFAEANLRGDELWKDLQDLAEASLHNNITGYESIQLYLQGFSVAGTELQPTLKQNLVTGIKHQLSFVDLDAMSTLLQHCQRFKFDEPELWHVFKKWTIYKLKKAGKDFIAGGNFPLLIHLYGRAATQGMFGIKQIENRKFFEDLFKCYEEVKEDYEHDPNNAILAYGGIVSGMSVYEHQNEDVKRLFNLAVQTYSCSLKVSTYMHLIQILSEKNVSFYFDNETVKVIQAFIVKNLPLFPIEKYYQVFSVIERLEEADQPKMLDVLSSTLNFFIQTNAQHELISEILKECEKRGMLTEERIQETKILFNII